MRFIILFIPLMLFAVNFKEVSAYPKSLAKNFYIWMLFNESNLTRKEIDTLFSQLSAVNMKLFNTYANISEDKDFLFMSKCLKRKDVLAIKDINCLHLSLTPYKLSKLPHKDISSIYEKLRHREDTNWIYLMSKTDLKSLLNEKNIDDILYIFNNSGNLYRKNRLNVLFNKDDIKHIEKSKKQINTFIKKVVINRDLTNIQKSILDLNSTYLNDMSYFYLGLNALFYGKKKIALNYFDLSYKKAYYRLDKDKALFWKYMSSKNERYIKELDKSFHVNIYTLYAKDFLGKSFDNIEYIDFKNIYSKNSSHNVNHPIFWYKTLNRINKSSKEELLDISKEFYYNDAMGYYTFILEKASSYKKNIFALPYEEFLDGLSVDEKALIYSIARQESRFINASVSTSFALGAMQIMPFLVKDISKKFGDNIKLTDMFIAKQNIKYAIYHIEWLRKRLSSPLFISYAYNGGIGFTKRMLKSNLFSKETDLEPYLSMELVPYDESREYTKKVMANYVIYKKYFKDNVSINSLLKSSLKHSQKLR